MARTSRLETLVLMLRQGFLPLFHHSDPKVASDLVRALHAGGAHLVEFTHRGDAAHEVFAALEREARATDQGPVIGAGSVADAAMASLYINLGAAFIVSPTMDDGIAQVCNRRKIPYLPGCATPTEVARAETSGAEIVKIFPGEAAGGPELVRSILGPSPWSRLMPTGGVAPTSASLSAWFAAGAACVGLGSALLPSEEIARGELSAITERVHDVVDLVAKHRAPLQEAWA